MYVDMQAYIHVRLCNLMYVYVCLYMLMYDHVQFSGKALAIQFGTCFFSKWKSKCVSTYGPTRPTQSLRTRRARRRTPTTRRRTRRHPFAADMVGRPPPALLSVFQKQLLQMAMVLMQPVRLLGSKYQVGWLGMIKSRLSILFLEPNQWLNTTWHPCIDHPKVCSYENHLKFCVQCGLYPSQRHQPFAVKNWKHCWECVACACASGGG